MKMEVLSVQNHQFQGQFGVIGSNKVKADWTSPLTPPPPPPLTHHSNNARHSSSNNTHSDSSSGVDTVDGPTHARQTHQQQQQNYSQQHNNYYHHYHHHHQQQQKEQLQHQPLAAMEAGIDGAASNAQQHQHHHHHHHQQHFTYNNNLLFSESVADANGIGGGDLVAAGARFVPADADIDAAAVQELSLRLQAELRAAKSRHLACTEVSLPGDLTPRIAVEIIKSSEREPCGVRGCSVFIEFEDEPNNTRRIGCFKVDPNTVSTFELYLTLKHDKSGWTKLLPQFLKNLTRSSTILISPDFSLTKNKLYSCE